MTRTHRSWLINPRYVVQVRPSGSGDHTVTLRNGAEVPLSRRFNSTLRHLRHKAVEG